MTTQTREDAVALVAEVIRDVQRSDRLLRRADDGHYYTTPDRTFLSSDGGRYTPPYVCIEYGGSDVSDEHADRFAEYLIQELDELDGD